MGGSISKEVSKIINDSTNKVVNGVIASTTSTQQDKIQGIIGSNIKIGAINANDCTVDIGNINENINMEYVSYLTQQNIASISSELQTELTNQMQQNQKIRRAFGSEWGTIDADQIKSTIENIVKNIVENSINNSAVSSQLAYTYTSISQNFSVGDINCDHSSVTLANINVLIENQVKQISESISNSVFNNNLMQKILNDADQTQDIQKSGIASVLAGLILPIIIIGGIAAVVFLFGFKQTVSSLLNWKFILAFCVLIAVYFTIAYLVKFWPWHKYYSIKLDNNKLRTDECERNDSGAFTSLNECNKGINNPKSLWYNGKFWGYNPEKTDCIKFSKAYQTVDGTDIYARYNDHKSCMENAPKDVYVLKKTIGQDYTGPAPPFLCGNLPNNTKCNQTNENPPKSRANNTSYSCQLLQNVTPDDAKYSTPHFDDSKVCSSWLTENSKNYYVPYCAQDKNGYGCTCQYITQVLTGETTESNWKPDSYARQADICASD